MKKAILSSTVILLIGIRVYPQKQNLLIRDGMTVSVLSKTWENNLPGDPKFMKAKKEERDELVASRNEEIISGKMESHRNLLTYKITKEHSPAGIDNFKYSTRVIGKEHITHLGIADDTLYIFRSAGIVPFGGDSAGKGFIYEGAQKIPFNIKLGEELQVYEDIEIIFPLTKKPIIKGFEEAGGTVWVYKDLNKVEPGVLNIAKVKRQSFYNVDAKVARSDEISIAGKKFDCFVIESECWTKAQTNETFKSSRIETAKAEGKLERKNNSKISKNSSKSEATNEAGYIVTYREEWFAPQLGLVRIRKYDIYNALVSETSIISFQ